MVLVRDAEVIYKFPETEAEVAAVERLIEKEGEPLPDSLKEPLNLPWANCKCTGFAYSVSMGEPDKNGHHPKCHLHHVCRQDGYGPCPDHPKTTTLPGPEALLECVYRGIGKECRCAAEGEPFVGAEADENAHYPYCPEYDGELTEFERGVAGAIYTMQCVLYEHAQKLEGKDV
jgi:hypothetical protein